MEGRIRQLEAILENAEIVEDADEGVVVRRLGRHHPLRGRRRRLAERYLLGHIEEQGELDVISPGSPLGAALMGQVGRRRGRVRRTRRGAEGRDPHGRTQADDTIPGAADRTGAPDDRRTCCRPLRCRPAAMVELPGRGDDLRAGAGRARPARADARAAARLDVDRRPQLVPRRSPPSAGGSGCSRSTTAATGAASARRRRSGWRTAPTTPWRSRRARHRAAHPRRLLDGRADRAAGLAPPPGPGGRPRAVRHRRRLRQHP